MFLKNNSPSIKYIGSRYSDSYSLHEEYCKQENYGFHILSLIKENWYRNISSMDNILFPQEFKTFTPNELPFIGNSKNSDKISFDSNFESGNLDLVIESSHNEFDLYMRVDTNTKGHLQWFYFSVTWKEMNSSVRFNICNFTKEKSLYSAVQEN